MVAALLLSAGLAVCGTNPSATPCDTTHIDVGIRLLRGGAAYSFVPHRSGYLFVARVAKNTAIVLYPQSPINQVSTPVGDTLSLVDIGEALESADVTLIIHWSSAPFQLPAYSSGETWDNAHLAETWSAIVSRIRKANVRVQVLNAELAGSEDAVVVATRMDEEPSLRRALASAPSAGGGYAAAPDPNAPWGDTPWGRYYQQGGAYPLFGQDPITGLTFLAGWCPVAGGC